ncbi:unnamed protein product [Hermetia illucens]|uniref:BTB domain-containing protein n=3 Tax=Hermetia illucens TaxID=343691 RepID=A0A7R8YUZ6_HERIL|nr:unnamed protein product [Hermetia illucens]
MEDCGFMKFTDEQTKASFLQSLHTMQKHRLFCDVVLNVGNSDIYAHKNVLACVSSYFMELFSADQESVKTHSEEIPSFRLNGGITKTALQILIDYAYTTVLEVPDTLVKDVYLAAWKLRMERVVKQCAQHLISEMTADLCIEIRSLPGIDKNKSFVQEVDAFIDKEFPAVSETAEFLQLPCAQIDVLYQTKQEMSLVTSGSLCRLVFDWIKKQLTDEHLTYNQLMERSHLLYLALDNSLQDCSGLPSGHESDTELVQDYKRLVLKCPNNKPKKKLLAATGRPRVLIYSRDINEREEEILYEPDWNFISSAKCGENTFVALATVNGTLMRVSVKMRLNTVNSSPTASPDLVKKNTEKAMNGGKDLDLFCEVATMSGPKCGLGVTDLEGKLLVCGGYDRAECLRKVESYCPETNVWTPEFNMIEARGRVQIATVKGIVYAVGGSNGTTELDTVECLKPGAQKWQKCSSLPLARSNAGVCSLNGKLYCIGGWNGQSGIRQCDVFSPEEGKWTSLCPLNTGRYQAGVTDSNGKLWAVGGSDAWNCLGSVEVYDPETDQWTYSSPLITARRGCGLAAFQGKLYAVGGSDGTQSLSSTEIFDEETKTWVLGPSLITPRSNVSVVVVQNKLYAIGGFSGKSFLNTMEYLDPATNEWTRFVPHQHDTEKITKVLKSQKSILENGNQSMAITNGINGHHDGNKSRTLNGDCDNHKEESLKESKTGSPKADINRSCSNDTSTKTSISSLSSSSLCQENGINSNSNHDLLDECDVATVNQSSDSDN